MKQNKLQRLIRLKKCFINNKNSLKNKELQKQILELKHTKQLKVGLKLKVIERPLKRLSLKTLTLLLKLIKTLQSIRRNKNKSFIKLWEKLITANTKS